MKNKVLIFDFDGTIADTFAAIVTICNQLADEYNFHKITMSEAQVMKNNTLKETIQQLNIPFLKIPIIITKAKTALFKDITNIRLIDGVKDVLIQLDQLGVQMGILTSNSTQNVEGFLKNHGLDVFDFVNSTSKIWSKDVNIKKVITAHDFKLDEVIYVGDETRDADAARRVGIKIASVTWGYNSPKVLSAQNPDYLITKPEQLLDIVK